MTERFDTVVIGGGIVGLATARAIQQRDPRQRVAVLEKEGALAGHQTGRNSGVIHAGVYYAPGSEKARLCTSGRDELIQFCRENEVRYEICGKVVVAITASELPRLAALAERCAANGVDASMVSASELREIEPHAAGLQALHVRSTGIADFPGVCRALAAQIVLAGGEIHVSTAVLGAAERPGCVVLETTAEAFEAARVVYCAGLHADRVARLLGGPQAAGGMMIVPFRGEYFELAPSRSHLVNGLIYPVPDPQFPFLGVHLTRGVSGRIHAGPNAVLALSREGYSWRAFNGRDTAEVLRFSGFRALAREHWKYGLSEMARSFSRRRFAAALARLVPEVGVHDLEPASSGVRAQAVTAAGELVQDFAFTRSNDGRALHVLNAPSPAATASLAIGRFIAQQL